SSEYGFSAGRSPCIPPDVGCSLRLASHSVMLAPMATFGVFAEIKDLGDGEILDAKARSFHSTWTPHRMAVPVLLRARLSSFCLDVWRRQQIVLYIGCRTTAHEEAPKV